MSCASIQTNFSHQTETEANGLKWDCVCWCLLQSVASSFGSTRRTRTIMFSLSLHLEWELRMVVLWKALLLWRREEQSLAIALTCMGETRVSFSLIASHFLWPCPWPFFCFFGSGIFWAYPHSIQGNGHQLFGIWLGYAHLQHNWCWECRVNTEWSESYNQESDIRFLTSSTPHWTAHIYR